jgi:cysteine desulfurase
MPSKRLYFDYAASTPVAPEVAAAMQPYFTEQFGNPGSLHSFGQEAINAIDRSRETIANAISASFREIVFTASATEANTLGIVGTIRKFRRDHPEIARPRIVLSAIEHKSALEAVRACGGERGDDVEVIQSPVDTEGRVNMQDMLGAVNEQTALVFCMYGHNELGTIQPIEEMAHGLAELRKAGKTAARFHLDAVQAFPFLPCHVSDLGIDLMTLSAQKIYGPKGVAALYVRGLDTPRVIPLEPLVHGGDQEYGLRSGTENVPGIVGFGKAVELLLTQREHDAVHAHELKTYCWSELKKIFPRLQVNGPAPEESLPLALPHILSIYLPDHPAQELLTALDLQGIAISAGSACSARSLEPSRAIEALGYPRTRAEQSVRISFGRPTTQEDIDHLITAFAKVLK